MLSDVSHLVFDKNRLELSLVCSVESLSACPYQFAYVNTSVGMCLCVCICVCFFRNVCVCVA